MTISPKSKFQLFKNNKNFCSAPWNLLYVWVDGSIKTCTSGSENFGNIHYSDLQTILSNPQLTEIKSNMLSDLSVDNCSRCISLENSGDGYKTYGFLRNMYNEQFLSQKVDYTDVDEFTLSAVDLHWSSICDLKCVTCWATQSSSLAQEQGLPTQHVKTEIALKLIDTIIKKQSTLKEVYLSGGEPTLIKYNLNLLSRLERGKSLLIRVNSNLMWNKDNSIVKEILKFPNVMFTCSVDNLGSKFEYIRRGANWQKFIENIVFLSSFSNVEIRINSVFFVLSALDLIETIDYFHNEHEIKNFTINQCSMGHTYLRCRNLPDNIKDLVRKNLQTAMYTQYVNNLNLVGSFNNCIEELNQLRTENYLEYFDHIDSLAGTTFKSLFPDLI
jgi:MoaA/NifB/PqqE/SkfB family radical SAM enzyme